MTKEEFLSGTIFKFRNYGQYQLKTSKSGMHIENYRSYECAVTKISKTGFHFCAHVLGKNIKGFVKFDTLIIHPNPIGVI